MRIFRKAFFIVNAVLLVLSACGNNTEAPVTTDPGTSTTTSAVVERNLVFTGKTSGGQVVAIEFFDDYLKSVLNGRDDNAVPTSGPNFPTAYELPFELKVTSFYYYGKQVDVTCEKDIYVNRVEQTFLHGTLPNGHTAIFSIGFDGMFYACDTILSASCDMPTDWVAQGPQDEITMIGISPSTIFGMPIYNKDFICNGSDGNEYTVGLYGTYDDGHVHAHSFFNIKTGVYTGVVSVKKAGSLDNPINLFLGQ
jgi:hypothetical protein